MSKSNIIAVSVVIIIALIIIAYAGYQSMTNENNTPLPTDQKEEVNPNQDKLITAKHQYVATSSKHYIAGTLTLPSICHELDTSVDVDREMTPVTATIHFDVTTTAENCSKAIGEARFKESFEAPKNAIIKATLNGAPVELNLIPVPKGEDISDFQIYVKG